MAVGMAVGVIAVISLLLVGILVITGGGDKSEKIIVPDLIGRNIDEVMADPDITDNFTVKEATERRNPTVRSVRYSSRTRTATARKRQPRVRSSR